MNNVDTLIIPGTQEYIVDGTIVMSANFPKVKWVVHKGNYFYQGVQHTGWYMSSIPDQTIIPLKERELCKITVISHECPPCPPHPCPHPSEDFDEKRAYELDHAVISVQTNSEKELITASWNIPDGKILRVNSDLDGKTHYYRWAVSNNKWIDITPQGIPDLHHLLYNQGNTRFDSLGIPKETDLGCLWNITDSFISDERFIVPDLEFPSNTLVYVTEYCGLFKYHTFNSVDMGEYQTKYSEDLSTEDKSVVGAINELYSEIDGIETALSEL